VFDLLDSCDAGDDAFGDSGGECAGAAVFWDAAGFFDFGGSMQGWGWALPGAAGLLVVRLTVPLKVLMESERTR
jgi:hypothetical protein